MDRGSLLTGSFAAAAVGARVARAEMKQDTMEGIEKAPPSLAGTIRFDREARAATTDDFGHIVGHDIAATVRWASEQGLRIAVQGPGHSVYGRAQVQDGLVVGMRHRQPFILSMATVSSWTQVRSGAKCLPRHRRKG